jgi:hypothetical protein
MADTELSASAVAVVTIVETVANFPSVAYTDLSAIAVENTVGTVQSS